MCLELHSNNFPIKNEIEAKDANAELGKELQDANNKVNRLEATLSEATKQLADLKQNDVRRRLGKRFESRCRRNLEIGDGVASIRRLAIFEQRR